MGDGSPRPPAVEVLTLGRMSTAPAEEAEVAAPAIWLETFGCQMNVLDSQLVAGRLHGLGYRKAASAETADVVLLNTCSVRDVAEQKVWSRLGRLARRQPRPRIGVMGCMAERQADALRARIPHLDIICGPSLLHLLPQMLAKILAAGSKAGPEVACAPRAVGRVRPAGSLSGGSAAKAAEAGGEREQACLHDGLTALDRERPAEIGPSRQAFVRITRGCNKFCSFCVVPFTRGAEVHRPPQDLVDEVRRLVDHGVQEVTLLGQTVNHYAHAGGGRSTSFADLLHRLHEAAPALPRLRFLTSYPRDFGDDALDAMAACPRICRFLHIPAQSGSDSVLKRMNRGYQRDAYLELLGRARARMPDIALSGDMIAGFPGETDEDLQLSLSLLDAARYKSCFIFKYSPRSGTVAHRRLPDDIDETRKKARLQLLLARQAEISLVHHRRFVGRRLRVLVDKIAQVGPQPAPGLVQLPRRPGGQDWVRLLGRTGGDEIVAFDGPPRALGHIVEVEAVGATHVTLAARMRAPTPAA